ncbi:phage tail protein [Bradyrhizobium sp. CCBAU 11361]|uniref:phage tail protein n=1 Tax=Bradyrhizobium sp. CCBAU 11361 TaxID=1630812 RepID=UPI00230237BB|nr:tail fiber protein [Bradyrhizobium sp. CCBAU 11361]
MSSTPYDRQTSFALFSAENPSKQQSGTDLDAEFNAVKIALDDTQQSLAKIQDADGVLKRGSVGRAQFDSSVSLGFAAPAQWASGVLYTANVNTVFHDSTFFIANTTHTSGPTFELGKWDGIADFTAASAIVDGSITLAKLADGAVAANKLADGVVSNTKIATGAVTTNKVADQGITNPKIADSAVSFTKLAGDANQVIPAGALMPYAGASAPDGWLLCVGQSVQRADYPALFAALGTTYGALDASHFTLPDMRGRVPAGVDGGAGRLSSGYFGASPALGATGGSENHALTTAQMPSHGHGVTDPGHTHGYVQVFRAGFEANGNGVGLTASAQGASTNSATTGVSIQSTGGGGAHNNVQPTIVLNYLIKAH